MAVPRRREGTTEDIGGIRWVVRRPPAWILLVIVAMVGWGLYYLITFSVTEVGTFKPAIVRAVLRI